MRITNVSLTPAAVANPEALEAISKADCIVLGPGDLYTSILPNLLVNDIARAISGSPAKKIYIVNLMTKYGQTYNYSATDHIKVIEKYIGCPVDYVLINNASIPKKALDIYHKYNEQPVVDDCVDSDKQTIIRADFVSKQFTIKAKSDTLVRSLIRHDSAKLAKNIFELFRIK
jgi:uncharacterized cofD-like protein